MGGGAPSNGGLAVCCWSIASTVPFGLEALLLVSVFVLVARFCSGTSDNSSVSQGKHSSQWIKKGEKLRLPVRR